MPLSEPVERQLSHTRQVSCRGYKRTDGLWDIEAYLLDTKSFNMDMHEGGLLPAGAPLHEMAIRITVDLDLNILEAEAVMDHTPFRMCPNIADRYKLLKGLQIAPGFTRKTRELFSGTQGCTHLLELLGPLATTAFQATHQEREYLEDWHTGSTPPPLLNSCHAFAEDSDVVKGFWPKHYKPHNDSDD
ncbi:DUF2889 domain-containing protein [Marinobacterium sp. D7]|uniref:DUF2889 domain-containing protein n=1 Tax=Marinobacterium ramblicola TaxID=2849041 RepID=UPI001C2DE73E|nr:DUF2889 domain-containing protein [Marinobacterium ramblicola]MBV1789229.1 DUF2889 domain-containing protein [Marinobacterium ramblicola]